MHHTRPNALLRRYILTASIFAPPGQDNFNIFDMFIEDPISSSITLTILILIPIAFLAFLTHRAILSRRHRYQRSRRERLVLEMKEEMDLLDYETASSESGASSVEGPWDGRGSESESSWEELDTCENGVRVQARKVQMRPVGRRISHEEYEDSDGEGFELVGCYLAQV